MAQDNQLVLEIVLDDGSIQRGFAKVKSSGEDAAKGIGAQFKDALGNIQNPTDILSGITLIMKSLKAVAVVAEKAFDFVLLGEQVKSTNAQFKLLADNATLSASALQSQLETAAAGLADTTDLLSAASQGIIKFGEGARALPEVLSLARQITAVFGGELTANFETLSAAIANGNSRALKSVGIFLDTDKVLKEYAKTLGVAADSLTQTEKQQAVLNATLEQGQKRYSAVDLSLRATTDSFARFKNIGKDALENVAVVSTSLFGPAFETVFDKATKILEAFNTTVSKNFGKGADQAKAKIVDLETEIERLEFRINKSFVMSDISDRPRLIALAQNLKEELRLAKLQAEGLSSAIIDPRQKLLQLNTEGGRGEEVANLVKRQQLQNAALLVVEDQFQAQKAAIKVQALDAQNAADIQKFNEGKIALETVAANFAAIEKARDDQFEADKKLIKDQFLAGQITSVQDRNNKIALLEDKHAKDVKTIQEKSAQTLAQLQEQSNQRRIQGFSNFFGNLSTLMNSSSRELFEVGKAAALAQATIDGYAAVMGAYKQGAIIGGPALGAAFAAAAGIAAAVNISKIATAQPGGSNTFSPGATGAPSIPSTPEPATQPILASNDEMERRTDTAVTVNITGDVLDSDETGLRITKILNDAFDKQGVVIRRGVFA